MRALRGASHCAILQEGGSGQARRLARGPSSRPESHLKWFAVIEGCGPRPSTACLLRGPGCQWGYRGYLWLRYDSLTDGCTLSASQGKESKLIQVRCGKPKKIKSISELLIPSRNGQVWTLRLWIVGIRRVQVFRLVYYNIQFSYIKLILMYLPEHLNGSRPTIPTSKLKYILRI